MTGDHPEIEEADLLLAKAARNDFAFAEHVQRRGLATDDAAELGELARASARLTRSMRQNLALLSKQKADREKAERERRDHEARRDAPPASSPADLRRERHMDDIQTGVSRVIVAAAGGDRRRIREHLERFDREMDDWTEQSDFEDYEPDEIIRHAGRVLGLPPGLADRWRDLPDPEWLPDPAPQPPASRRDPARPLNWPPSDDDTLAAEADAPPTAAADSS
ncbi:MAG: hypothetical protein U1C74_27710 [Phenylobacterium sp.]|nr:hypothetical protein [Phenylobacterium sp.]